MSRKPDLMPAMPAGMNAGKDLFDIKRLDKARKGWYSKGYGLKAAGKKRKKPDKMMG